MWQFIRCAAALLVLVFALSACGSAPAATGSPAPPASTAPPSAMAEPPSVTAPMGTSAPPDGTVAPAPTALRRGTAAALGVTLIPATEPPLATPLAPSRATPAPALGGGTSPHIQQAIADLAARLAVDPGTIKVLRAEEVDWPDGSLGCPRDDMSYTQAIVNGVFVQLEAGGQTYNYHGRTGDAPFLCTSKRAILPEDLPPELRGGGGEDT